VVIYDTSFTVPQILGVLAILAAGVANTRPTKGAKE
jgi:hypothetical protein